MINHILIDGSNFYYKLKGLTLSDKKFSFPSFCNWISEKNYDKCSYYVGAVRQEENNKKSKKLYAKQRSFLSSLQKEGVNIELGFILKTDDVYHEKGVDVKIATDLLIGAYENLYEKAYLVSSDTDLIPAVKKVVALGKHIVYVGFSQSPSYALLKTCPSSRLLSEKDLRKFV